MLSWEPYHPWFARDLFGLCVTTTKNVRAVSDVIRRHDLVILQKLWASSAYVPANSIIIIFGASFSFRSCFHCTTSWDHVIIPSLRGRPAQPQDVSADVEDLVHPDRSGMVSVTYSSSNNPGSGKWMKMDENESLPDSFTVMSSSTSMIIGTTWQNSQFETRFFKSDHFPKLSPFTMAKPQKFWGFLRLSLTNHWVSNTLHGKPTLTGLNLSVTTSWIGIAVASDR